MAGKGNFEIHRPGSRFSTSKGDRHRRMNSLKNHILDNDFDKILKTYPITLEIGVSGPGNCPHRCSFCNHGSHYNDKATMDLGTYLKFIDEVTSYGPGENAKAVIFSSSGEATVNPEVNQILKYTRDRGLDISLITNGWGWANLDRKPWLAKEGGLVDAVLENVDWARTSINAGTPETRKAIHGVNDYWKVLDGLTYVAQRKKELGSNCELGSQIVVTRENMSELDLCAKNIKKTGIDYLQIKPVIAHPNSGEKQLDADTLNHIISVSQAVKDDYDDGKGKDGFEVLFKEDQFIELQTPGFGRSYGRCWTFNLPIIEATGDVFHCSQTRGMSDFLFGNLKEETFKEIWEGDKRREIVEGIKGAVLEKKCQPVCRGHWENLKHGGLGQKKGGANFL